MESIKSWILTIVLLVVDPILLVDDGEERDSSSSLLHCSSMTCMSISPYGLFCPQNLVSSQGSEEITTRKRMHHVLTAVSYLNTTHNVFYSGICPGLDN